MKKIRLLIAACVIILNIGLILSVRLQAPTEIKAYSGEHLTSNNAQVLLNFEENNLYAKADLKLSGERAMPDTTVAHFEANSLKDFLLWLRNPNENKETFKEYIDYWTKANCYLVPEFEGGQLNKIFVDSNQKFISFVFNEPEVRVTYESIGNTDDFDDIFGYMEKKYSFEYDKMIELDVNSDPLSYNNGYEYNRHIYTKEKLVMKNHIADCVCETSYSEKSSTCYNIAFMYNDLLVRLICYTEPGVNLDKSMFANLSLAGINGSPLNVDPPTVVDIISPTETPIPTETPTPTPTPTATKAPTVTPNATDTPTVERVNISNMAADKISKNTEIVGKAKIVSVKNVKKRSLLIKFKSINHATSYRIQYADNSKFKKAKVKEITKQKIMINNLKKDKIYYVRVCGVNNKGLGVWSKVKKIKITK